MADEGAKRYTLEELLTVMARLRDPVAGCPWDVQQTFGTIAPYTIEEAYEVADMKNTGGKWGGSISAAQFLQRFVKDGTAWAHLDIAGTGLASPESEINRSWGSGFGVRLLDRLVSDHYEQH